MLTDSLAGRSWINPGNSNLRIVGTDLPDTDITRADHVRGAIAEVQPELVINAAAYTTVDKAEEDAAAAFRVNAVGAKLLADVCETSGTPMIHISTDYVFDGTGETPYSEDAPLSPVGVYGISKAQGETHVRNHLERHIIVRTSWLYGVFGHNFVKTMLKVGTQREEIGVIVDQRGCPTNAGDFAAALLSVAEQIGLGDVSNWGTYHYCGKGETTWYHFAEAIFETARHHIPLKVTRVIPISTESFGAPAPRPAYSALSCERIRQSFGIDQRPWRDSLNNTVVRILSESDPDSRCIPAR